MLETNDHNFIETEEKEDSTDCDEDQASEEIPQSLLSYFEISQSRAAVCERLILNELEASHYTEGQEMNIPNKDLQTLDEQNKNEENQNDDTFLNKHPNTEDDGALDESLKEKYIHDLVKCKNNQEEKQRKRREIHFQEDLQKIMTSEKHNQVELELNKRRDYEKLEHELQLQQENINNRQKQVEDIKRMIEVEQKRQQEIDERKMVEREERKRKKEEEKRRQERRLIKEEKKRKMKERKLKEEEKRKEEEEEEMRKKEEEEKRKSEEENRLREEMAKEELKRKKDEELKEEERKRLAEEIKRKKKERKENQEEVKSVKKDNHEVVMNYRQIKKQNEEEKPIQETDMKQLEDEKRNITEEEKERIIKDKCMMEVTGSKMSVKEITQSDSMSKLKNSEEDKQKINDKDENGSEEVIRYVDQLVKNCGKMEKTEEKMMAEVMRKEEKVKNEIKGVEDGGRTNKNVSDRTKSEKMQAGERWVEEGKTEGNKEKMRKEVNGQKKNVTERMEELKSGRILDTGDQERHSKEENIQTDTNTTEKESREGLNVPAFHSLNLISSSDKTCSSISLRPIICPTSGDGSHLESTECLPDHTEQKKLLWMKECNPWSKMSLQNLRKHEGSSQRGTERTRRRVKDNLPPLSANILLHCTGCTSLEQVTMVTLEDLDGCSLSTVAQCPLLHSLTLRRCGLRALEGISKLQKLLYVDVQENDISYVDCENMTSLRILRLSHNKLTSIHGLRGVNNLDYLDLSHNSIIRIAGLEFTRRLQRLLVDHNQLISTEGLRDVPALLHLDLSHNHLAAVEGLENSSLLHSLDLRANSLTEIPILNNQVLLRELYVDDNNLCSLQGLSACWLPLMHHLSVAQNRIIELPSMWDFVSLQNLDLRFNLLSELKDVCRNLEGCNFLHVVHLAGNPLQQESDWRCTLQTAVSGLKAIDDQQTDSFQQVNSSPGFFQTFCQAQLKQTRDLEQRHSRRLNIASPTYGAIKELCLHFNLTLKLAENQRFAHEYGDTTVSKHWETDLTTKENTSNCRNEENLIGYTEETTSSNELPDIFKEVAPAETEFSINHSLKQDPVNGRTSFAPQRTSVDLKSTAAAVIQQRWRKYKEKCRNVNALVIVKKEVEIGECEGKPESEPSCMNTHALNQDSAACAIQAFWRGFALRRRLTSALAAVTCPDAAEDDTLEEVDLDEFVFDEELFTFSEDFLHDSAESEQRLHLQPIRPYLDLYQRKPASSPPKQTAKQAWVTAQHSATPDRTKFSSTSVPEGLSNRTESIQEEWGLSDSNTVLLMLKRAQNMKSTKQLPKKHQGQPVTQTSVRNSNYLLGTSETRQRPAPRKRSFIRVGGAKLGLQQVDGTEQTKQEPTQRWIHTQAARSDQLPESEHFLPDIHSSINGGKVQLAGQADPTYADRQHHSTGFWALSSLPAQLVNNYPRGNAMHHTSIGGLKLSSDRERPTRSPHSGSPSATLQNFLPDVSDDPPSRVRHPSQTCLRRITF